MKLLERTIERLLLASRWLLVVFYAGLGLALIIYAVTFVKTLVTVAFEAFQVSEDGMILAMLTLIDAALVASLTVMVMIAGYENFVGSFEESSRTDISWLGKLDAGGLKIKLASSIVAISSVHLLQVFLNVEKYDNTKIMWLVIVQLTFVACAVLLGYLEKIMAGTKHSPD
jgi:uncharacterized protein (TIGR00645 family)